MISELVVLAGTNARRRINYNIHESLSDPVQRLFVASWQESYFRPHRHPEKWELALVIRGLFDVIVFDNTSRIIERISLGPEAEVIGFEMPPNTWHSWVPMINGSVFFETKQGPYDAQSASEFAAWSPEEGTTLAQGFTARLRQTKIGDLVTK